MTVAYVNNCIHRLHETGHYLTIFDYVSYEELQYQLKASKPTLQMMIELVKNILSNRAMGRRAPFY